MASTDQTVRVFISSTFRDMHAERDHLVTVVFPELRERVEQLGLEFFDVDLRWGVPTKDANGETANSWEYCRQWIDRVEPFFVCILGRRYGWEPEPEQLKDADDRQRQQAQRRSITDMEVCHAVLNSKLKRRSYFYLRETEAPASAAEFVDPPALLEKLMRLKDEVRSCGRPVRDYACEWTGSRFTGMDEFGRRVLDDLWSGVLRDERYVSKEIWRQALEADPDTDSRYTDESKPIPPELCKKLVELAKPEPKEPLEAERQQMEAFAALRLRWFQGREMEIKHLTDFLNSTDADTPRLAVVAAVPGQGKSALLAKLSTLIPEDSTFLVTHFVGATERSASAYSQVKRLLDELERSGIAWPAEQLAEGQEPKLDFNSLCLRLAQRLGDYTGERRIVILLDALNQLSEGHDLQWLPYRLGPSVRVVVSCVENDKAKADSPEQRVLQAVASRRPTPLRVPLGELTEADVRAIVVAYLKEYCKELDISHVDAICAMPQARNPLYLLVMLGELRTLGGNDMNQIVPKLIASMPQDHPDTVNLFRWVLKRLEVFGRDAVQWWCLYLAHGRIGMSSHELAELLARKLGPDAAATALLIERGLRRYLLRRGPQLDFFHCQLCQAVFQQYGPRVEGTTVHAHVVEYFHDLADPENNQSWRGTRPRPFRELPYHFTRAEMWSPLVAALKDIFFLEAKNRHGQALELVEDFDDFLVHLPANHSEHRALGFIREALRRDVHFIARHAADYPQGLFQCLWNSCWWYDCPERHLHYFPGKESKAPASRDTRSINLYRLLEHWRHQKQLSGNSFAWVRSLRPPYLTLGTAQQLVLRGHEGGVRCLSLLPTSKRVVSGSDDYTVRVWDMVTGSEISCLRGHSNVVNSVAASDDELTIISGSDDRTLRRWDVRSGELLSTWEHKAAIRDVAATKDMQLIVSTTFEETNVRQASTGEILFTLKPAEHDAFYGMELSEDDKYVVTHSASIVQLWEIATGREWKRIDTCHGLICALAISRDGLFLATGGQSWITDKNWDGQRITDHTLRLWNVEDNRELWCSHAHCDDVSSITFTAGGTTIVTGSRDGTIRMFESKSGEILQSLRGHEGGVTSIVLSPSAGYIVSGASDHTIRVWDVRDSGDVELTQGPGAAILSVAIDNLRQRVITGDESGDICLWSAVTGQVIRCISAHSERVNSVSITADGTTIVSCSDDRTIGIWAAETGQVIRSLNGRRNYVNSVAISPDAKLVVFGEQDDPNLFIWNADENWQIRELPGHDDEILDIKYSQDGRRAASWDLSGKVILWSTVGWEPIDTFQGTCDLQAIADQVRSLAKTSGCETCIYCLDGETPRAYCPEPIYEMRAFDNGATFAGRTWKHLFIVSVEGDRL